MFNNIKKYVYFMSVAFLALTIFACGQASGDKDTGAMSDKASSDMSEKTMSDTKTETMSDKESTTKTETTSDKASTTNNANFASMTTNEETILINASSKLAWVNSAPGCLPLSAGMDAVAVKAKLKSYCGDMVFSGKDNWRAPSSDELKAFLLGVDKQGITPFYKNAGCPRLVGMKDGTVATINTHNNPPIGQEEEWKNLNAGMRCVSDSSSDK